MKTYRLKLRLRGSYATPFDADTIFGGLCWTLRYFEGEKALRNFLNEYFENRPPLILSNGFPGDYLPKPLIPRSLGNCRSQKELISSAKEAKRIKKISFLTPEEFLAMAQGKDVNISDKEKLVLETVTIHNQINRSLNTTAAGGQLYETMEFYNSSQCDFISVYVRSEERFADRFMRLFEKLGQSGLGKRKSSGSGAFSVMELKEFEGFTVDNPNAFITLSNFVPSSSDPTEGFYHSKIKYGKLGEHYALSECPFKRPLFMIKAGSVFLAQTIRPYYGRLVKNVVPQKPEVVHYGYAFALPAYVKGGGLN